MSLQGNDAFLVGPQRAVTEANTRSFMVFPVPIQLPSSPISPTLWRPQQAKLGMEENFEGLDDASSHSAMDNPQPTIKRNKENEPKALAIQQSQSNERKYRSDNSAQEYKLIRYFKKFLI